MENNLNNLPPFYVGQKVVALKTQEQGAYEKGCEYVVKQLTHNCCKWVISIGNTSFTGYVNCAICGKSYRSKIWWHAASSFAPITSQFETISYTRVMETEAPMIGVN